MRARSREVAWVALPLGWASAIALSACNVLVDVEPSRLGPGPGPSGGTCTQDCDDHIPCTIDECNGENECVHRPDPSLCNDGVGCTEDLCDPQLGCQNVERNDRCEFCAPGSVCDSEIGGCVGFRELRDCSDNDPCTRDFCDPSVPACMSEPHDMDEDGYAAARIMGQSCGGEDCDDQSASTYPGAPEVCDGRDNDCNGQIDDGCAALPNDCDTAQRVSLGEGGRVTLEGTFEGLTSTFDVGCGKGGARDALYRIPVEGVADIVVRSAGNAEGLVLALGTSCSAEGFREACAAPMRGGQTRLSVHRYDANDLGRELILLIEAEDPSIDRYQVEVSVQPAVDDVCAPTSFDFTGCGTMVGFMEKQAGNTWGRLTGSCQGFLSGLAPEAVVRVRGSETGQLMVRGWGDGFQPVLYARSQCVGNPQAVQLACAAPGPLSGGQTELRLELSASEEAFLVVDEGFSGAYYTLTCNP